MGGTINKLMEPEISPGIEEFPTFAPNDGFAKERKKIGKDSLFSLLVI
jgi:hypothetical protein